MNTFKEYMLVGGILQAVLAYLPDKNFERADLVKRNIINLYHDDVTKFIPRRLPYRKEGLLLRNRSVRIRSIRNESSHCREC